MKKLLLFLPFLFIIQFQVNAAISINGISSNCTPGLQYQYQIIGSYDLGSSPYWTISNGVLTSGNVGHTANVKWNNGATSGTISVSATVNGKRETHTMPVSIKRGEPNVSNLSISTSGNLKTYNYINLNLNYNSDANSGLSYTVTWTINNAGSVKTLTGNPVTSIILTNIGTTTITAKLKYTQSSIEHTATKTINIADGSLAIPNLDNIYGHRQTIPGRRETYFANHYDVLFPNIKYNWKVNGYTLSESTKSINYTFRDGGFHTITCSATNTKTGQTGNTVSLSVEVFAPPTSYSLFQVVNMENSLIVSEVEKENQYVQFRSNKQISYQINNLLTGTLVDKGKVISGSSIDASKLPKGIYVLTLNDGIMSETHKISIQ